MEDCNECCRIQGGILVANCGELVGCIDAKVNCCPLWKYVLVKSSSSYDRAA